MRATCINWATAPGHGGSTKQTITEFLSKLDQFSSALEGYPRHDNSMLFSCVDELIQRRARNEKRPNVLNSPAMAKSEGS